MPKVRFPVFTNVSMGLNDMRLLLKTSTYREFILNITSWKYHINHITKNISKSIVDLESTKIYITHTR